MGGVATLVLVVVVVLVGWRYDADLCELARLKMFLMDD
jgi:hypothetical protein